MSISGCRLEMRMLGIMQPHRYHFEFAVRIEKLICVMLKEPYCTFENSTIPYKLSECSALIHKQGPEGSGLP